MNMRLVHCSFHKCLTVYFKTVMLELSRSRFVSLESYRHFKSLLGDFYAQGDGYQMSSVNNHAIDLDRLGDCRVSRFIRDPRDLVVSGYFYHKRGAEPWCDIADPTDSDWAVVNGSIPDGLRAGESYAGFLNRVPLHEGLVAEIQFRKKHFESMRRWPTDSRVRLFAYEELIGREGKCFYQLLKFHGFSTAEAVWGGKLASRRSASKAVHRNGHVQGKHIRNASPNQWKEHFNPEISEFLECQHPGLLEALRYE